MRILSGPCLRAGRAGSKFLDRAEEALYRVATDHPGELVVIACHGGVVDASLIRFLGLRAHGGLVRFFPDNASMTEWAFTGARWWLVRFNDAAHLDPGGPDHPGLRITAPLWVRLEQPGLTAFA